MKVLRETTINLLATASIALIPVLGSQAAFANLVNVSPTVNAQDVTASSQVYGVFDRSGGTVNPNSVKIFIDGRDVTRESTITPAFFSYTPAQDLRAGTHKVRVEYQYASSAAPTVSEWSFSVQQPQAALEIASVTHNATGGALGAGTTFIATVTGTPGSQAKVMLLDGTTMRQLPAQEVGRGTYVATLNLGSSDRINQGIVIASLERQGKMVYGAASQAVVFQPNATVTQVTTANPGQTPQTPQTGQTPQVPTTTTALRPAFISHKNGDVISSEGFTLTGQTQPNASVRVIVNYTDPTPFIGGSGQLLDTTVKADSSGTFIVPVPRPGLLNAQIKYDVLAIARNGNQSEQTQLSLTQR